MRALLALGWTNLVCRYYDWQDRQHEAVYPIHIITHLLRVTGPPLIVWSRTS